MPSGTRGVSFGRPTPWGQYSSNSPLDGRSVQMCASRTAPIAPDQTSSCSRRVAELACPLLPICVATFASRAASASRRDSQTECVSGFSQYTCLPRRMASIDANAWWWSGVETTTPSISFTLSSIRR
jgi:hypothetical protein